MTGLVDLIGRHKFCADIYKALVRVREAPGLAPAKV